jgi:hypothetical protein
LIKNDDFMTSRNQALNFVPGHIWVLPRPGGRCGRIHYARFAELRARRNECAAIITISRRLNAQIFSH